MQQFFFSITYLLYLLYQCHDYSSVLVDAWYMYCRSKSVLSIIQSRKRKSFLLAETGCCANLICAVLNMNYPKKTSFLCSLCVTEYLVCLDLPSHVMNLEFHQMRMWVFGPVVAMLLTVKPQTFSSSHLCGLLRQRGSWMPFNTGWFSSSGIYAHHTWNTAQFNCQVMMKCYAWLLWFSNGK